ncbi:MAG: hypothetical protein ACXWJB_12655 [Limisphaerales bacterium]
MSIDQLIAKLEKLSTQVEKGMTKHGFTVWTAMIRQDLYSISSAEARKGALKLLGVVECSGFCLDKVPEARQSLILPNLKPLIEYLKENGRKKGAKASKVDEVKQAAAETPTNGEEGVMEWGVNVPDLTDEGPIEWGYNPS